MNRQIPFHIITRNISSEGLEYTTEIREWLKESEENKELYDNLLQLWKDTGSLPEYFTPDRTKAWQKVNDSLHLKKKKHYLNFRIGQIAAALLIGLLTGWAGSIFSKRPDTAQYTEVISPAGQKTQVRLPDSSLVLLNGNSSLRYSQEFNHDSRKVELRGEGYFDVRKDLSRKFIVSTPEIDVKVYGTSFNVKAYGNDQFVEVGLKTGKIGLERNASEIMSLRPGQVALYRIKEKKIDVKETDMNLVSAWTRDEMVFEEDSLQEIIKYMDRWYGVNIQVSPQLLDGELLTFKVKTESLSELLKLINLFKPIKYHIDGKQVIITKP